MKYAPRVGPPASGPSRPTGTGTGTEDLLVALQILPGFFSNCLFLALYDSVLLLKRAVSLLRASRSARGDGEWQRALTSEGLRAIWRGFLLDAHKQVKLGGEAPNSTVVNIPGALPCAGISGARGRGGGGECHLLDFESSDRPLVVNFGSAT